METPLQILIFNEQIQKNSAYSVSGRSFVLTKRLKLWLNSIADTLEPLTMLEILFNTVVVNEASGNGITPPWQSDSVLIFCILIQLGVGNRLQEFVTNGISDKSLPFQEQDLHSLAKDLGHVGETFASKFFVMQWQYLPATLDLDRVYEWPQEKVIPICYQNLIAEGRTAKVYEVAIPEDFIGPNLAHAFPRCRRYLDSDSSINPGWYYRFALKTFNKWNTKLGEREMAIFRKIENHEGFVSPLAAFRSNQIQSSKTIKNSDNSTNYFNILFELCEMDLSSYFVSKNPPVTPRDIERFWTNISRVVEALSQLHGATAAENRSSTKYIGYHHDIKPSNILLCGENFKLSDFGFASFGATDDLKLSPPTCYGTVSYGPPTPNIYTTVDRSLEGFQKFDLWSLGCVLSEAATWVILGCSGIKNFNTLRHQTLDKICTIYEKKEPKLLRDINFNIPRRGDYFHDGTDVLAAVTLWHKFLRNAVNRSDTVTCRLLDIIDQGLLVGNIKERLDANDLYIRIKDIIDEGAKEARLLPG